MKKLLKEKKQLKGCMRIIEDNKKKRKKRNGFAFKLQEVEQRLDFFYITSYNINVNNPKQ